jgi:hypothetical protein
MMTSDTRSLKPTTTMARIFAAAKRQICVFSAHPEHPAKTTPRDLAKPPNTP